MQHKPGASPPQHWKQPPRRCACGGTPGPDGECAACKARRLAAERQQQQLTPQSAPPIVHDVLRSPGQPLDADTRALMEPRFGHSFGQMHVHAAADQIQTKLTVGDPDTPHEHEAQHVSSEVLHRPPTSAMPGAGYDFSQVRIHTDARAAAAARTLHAAAFTQGRHIVFGAGQYAPSSPQGQRLLAHELTHVVQQQRQPSATIQRALTIVDPGATAPNQPVGGTLTNAQMAEGWIDQLCPTGNWTVDAASGVVSSPDRATFCARRPRRGQAHFSQNMPTSCRCLCQLTAAGSKDIRIHVADTFTVGGSTIDVRAAGEGVTLYPSGARTEYNVGVSGREFSGITGAGDTAPLGGANPTQTLRDPPWIIFAHEVCGHARQQTAPMGQTQVQHSQTPEGDRGAVDIENRVRREHSTIADNLGIRRGSFRDAAGNFHDGSVYRVSSGETLSGIARRCGIPIADMLNRIFRANGDAITAATQNRLAVNERLLIEGIFWHEVITGETMTSIAQMWVIPLASLIRANPQISDPNLILPGQRLLIPAS
ncbi:MAG TPA: DUF4157 domain-containing protein [Herpetosiphonaceae bacterium]